MRNLKRVVCLALSTAMLLGMMVMGAGAADKTAADLTDSDKIVNKEAVTLLVDLGVIEGKTDGSYSPTEVVNRATMAKLITMMLVGNVDQNSYKGTATDLKDVDGHWAEGYIKYCYSNKIITGDGAGHFFPDQPVTVVQAAKMILVALGYDADHSKYQNDANWSNNIMRDATTTKMTDAAKKSTVRSLIKGASVKASDSLTRDNAAQMIFNGLFVDTVEPKYEWDMGVQRINGYDAKSSLAATIYGGLERKTGTLSVAGDKTSTIDGKSVKIASTSSDIGANVVYYVDDSAKVISSAAVAAATEVLGTSMNGTAYSKLTTPSGTAGYDKKAFIAEEDSTVLYYLNGKKKDNASDIENDTKLAGVIVDLIDNNGNGKVDVVKVIKKTVASLKNDNATRVYKEKDQVNVSNVTGGYVDIDKVHGYEDLAKGDVVLYYTTGADADKEWFIETAETITGKISGYKGDTIRVNGSYYGFSGVVNAGDTAKNAVTTDGGTDLSNIDVKNEFTFALDNAGNIAYVTKNTDESTGEIAIVLEKAKVEGGGIGKQNYVEVKLLLADGTTEIGTVAKVGSKTTVSDVDNAIKQLDFFTYKVDADGKYELTAVESTSVKSVAAETEIKNGKTPVTSSYTANAKTLYLVAKGTGKDITYSTYTGYNAVPSMKVVGSNSKVVLAKNSTTIAQYVYLETGSFEGDAQKANYVYLIDPASFSYVAKDGDVPAHYDYDAIVDGVKDVLSVDAKLSGKSAGLYKDVKIVDGIADDASITTAVTGTTYTPATHSVGNGIVMLDQAYTYDDETVVYVIAVGTDAADVTETTCDGLTFYTDAYDYELVPVVVKTGEQLLSSLYVIQTEKS